MAATPLTEVAQRLLANVERDHGDLASGIMRLPTTNYTDPVQYQREIEQIFHKVPLAVALTVDIPNSGDYLSYDIANRAIVVIRGDDGVARTFVNACRHRGAPVVCNGAGTTRRLTCPYHAWVFDTKGNLVGLPQREQFGDVSDLGDLGLFELPTAERAGIVFSVLTPGAAMDIDEWLGDMQSALQMLELDKVYPHTSTTTLQSGNWKSTADGYLDGYHIGFLHSSNLGLKQVNNRNTWDLFGPHVRLGFANKTIVAQKGTAVDTWDLPDVMSLVHYVFPNVSISGQPGRDTMVSRLLPGPGVSQASVVQFHYSRVPLDSPDKVQAMETRRKLYAAITGEEDFDTVIDINRTIPGMGGADFFFGRNESGNQNLHTWVARLSAG